MPVQHINRVRARKHAIVRFEQVAAIFDRDLFKYFYFLFIEKNEPDHAKCRPYRATFPSPGIRSPCRL
jgi:hypothetical protein